MISVKDAILNRDIGKENICHICGSPVNKNTASIWPDGFYYHDLCKINPVDNRKLDQGKNRLNLVLGGFSRALQEVGKVGTFGAKKYTDDGWMEVPDAQKRYKDALLRHFMADAQGISHDDETELLHMAAVAWNALAVLDLILREKEG